MKLKANYGRKRSVHKPLNFLYLNSRPLVATKYRQPAAASSPPMQKSQIGDFRFEMAGGKAVEGYRSPRRFASHRMLGSPPGLGLRQPSGALVADLKWATGEKLTLSLPKEKRRATAVQDASRVTGCLEVRQVLDCASPLALWWRT